jgi:rRNA maturation protein Nop10
MAESDKIRPDQAALDALIAAEGLNPDAARAVVARAVRDGRLPPEGDVVAILRPMSRFTPGNPYGQYKRRVLARIRDLLEQYHIDAEIATGE